MLTRDLRRLILWGAPVMKRNLSMMRLNELLAECSTQNKTEPLAIASGLETACYRKRLCGLLGYFA